MSMHLAGPGLTTTSYKKRKQKITKTQQADLERGWRDRNVRLKQMGLQKETFEQYLVWVYGAGKKEKKEKKDGARSQATLSKKVTGVETSPGPSGRLPTDNVTQGQDPALENISKEPARHGKLWVKGACTIKQTPTYTGTKILGIGTMHKSNAVPIFSDEEAIDISRMRR